MSPKIKRRIIYVDASGKESNTEFKISIYDPEKSLTHILQLRECNNNSEAERYAIFYALFYIKKFNYKNTHILSDNLSAVNDKYIKKASKELGITVSWIPREINIIADKMSKSEPTLKEKDWNILKLFVDLYTREEFLNSSFQNSNEEDLTKQLLNAKNKINEQKKVIKSKDNQIAQLKKLKK